MNAVPTKDYARQYAALLPELRPALEAALLRDEPCLGRAVERFEVAFAATHGEGFLGVGTGSGTDAAVLLYRALGLRPGDEVVTNAHTFAGVLTALRLARLRPVLVDPEPTTGLMAIDAVEAVIGPRTRAVLAVHLHGHPERGRALAALCARRGLRLLEDCAQAHGAWVDDQPVGTWGDAAIYSFHPSKNLGAFGDAGLVLTRDAAVAERVRCLRNMGKADKYAFAEVAPVARMDTLQAVILSVKLRHLSAWQAHRAALADAYLSGLSGLPGVELPHVERDTTPAWHLFVVRCAARDALRAHLAARGVQTGMHYPVAAADHAPFRGRVRAPGGLVEARRRAAQGLTLPLSHEHTLDEAQRVIEAVCAWRAA